MANQLKYVIMKTDLGREFPVIFADVLSHKGMAEHVAHLYSREGDRLGEDREAAPVSAGFVQSDGDIACFGESETLKLKSRGPVDDAVVKQWG